MKAEEDHLIKFVFRAAVFCLVLGFPATIIFGCHKKILSQKPPDQLYNAGMYHMTKKRGGFLNPPDFEKARKNFEEIVYDNPTSRYAPVAELRIADTYYEAGEYGTSADLYFQWRKHHVGRPEVPYAIYRTAMSYYHLMLSMDRDQSSTLQALECFHILIADYSDNEYTKAIGEKITILEVRLARHEMYVGKFYFRHRRWWSAVDRFQAILDQYPRKGFDEEALFFTWKSYRKLGRFNEAADVYGKMVNLFPNGDLTKHAKGIESTQKGKGARSWLGP